MAADRWMIRGAEYTNCNCSYGCPCQFNAPSTNGFCQTVDSGRIDEGYFNDIRLDGLAWVLLLQWPGEIAEGKGKQQAIIDQRADEPQREALRKILHGESTAPGTTHFFVYNSTVSQVLETLYEPIDLAIDIEARKANLHVSGLVESKGSPIIDPQSGNEHRAQIRLPHGFEFTIAEMGSATSRTQAGIKMEMSDSYGQFNILHMNQDGVIR